MASHPAQRDLTFEGLEVTLLGIRGCVIKISRNTPVSRGSAALVAYFFFFFWHPLGRPPRYTVTSVTPLLSPRKLIVTYLSSFLSPPPSFFLGYAQGRIDTRAITTDIAE